MKLLFCKNCNDVFRIQVERERICQCGKTRGQYHDDDWNAWYKGKEAIPLGFANSTFVSALANQPETGWGKEFTAFVIQRECKTFENRTHEDN